MGKSRVMKFMFLNTQNPKNDFLRSAAMPVENNPQAKGEVNLER